MAKYTIEIDLTTNEPMSVLDRASWDRDLPLGDLAVIVNEAARGEVLGGGLHPIEITKTRVTIEEHPHYE